MHKLQKQIVFCSNSSVLEQIKRGEGESKHSRMDQVKFVKDKL